MASVKDTSARRCGLCAFKSPSINASHKYLSISWEPGTPSTTQKLSSEPEIWGTSVRGRGLSLHVGARQ